MTDRKKKARRAFDAVQLMRDLRRQLSEETEGMSYAEEKNFIRRQLAKKDTRTSGDAPDDVS